MDKIKTDFKTADAFLGSMVHECLFILHRDDEQGKRRSLEDALGFYRREWAELWNENVHIIQEGLTQDHFRSRGEHYICDYYQNFFARPRNGVKMVSLEERNLMDLPDGNKFHIIIDRLSCQEDRYLVCDYKTSTTLPSTQEAMNDRQLAMYALWVRENYPDAGRVVQQWHMLHFGKVVEIEHSVEELRSCREEVVRRIAEIERCSDFPATRSKLCDYCEYKDICPEFMPATGVDHADAANEAVDLDKLVDELHSIDGALGYIMQRKKDIEQQLLQYSDRSGAMEIVGSKAIASIVPYETVKMPEHFTEFLIENDLLAKYGCVSSSKVRSAVLKGTADPLILRTVRRTTEKRVKLKGR